MPCFLLDHQQDRKVEEYKGIHHGDEWCQQAYMNADKENVNFHKY